MDWDKLRIFHAVADAGSLTHAGDKLNLSQSALSVQIKQLEDRLGHALSSFSELSDGDYVVHATHGVARYLGMHKIETPKSQQQKRQEFLRRARDSRYRVGDEDILDLALSPYYRRPD